MALKIQPSNAQYLPKKIAAAQEGPSRTPRDPDSKTSPGDGLAGGIGRAVQGPPARQGESPAQADENGVVFVSLDPSKRPAAADLERGGFASILDVLKQAGGALFGDMSGGKTVAELRAAADNPATLIAGGRTGPVDFVGGALSDLRSASGRADPGTNDKPGLYSNPRTGQAMADPPAGGADAPKPAEKKDDKSKLDKVVDTVKDTAKNVASYLADVFIEKFGPPGLPMTALTGPAALDDAGGDVGAILDGAKTTGKMQDGNYFDKKFKDNGFDRTPTPDGGDAPANAGEAKARGRIGAIIGAMVGKFAPRLAYGDKESLIGQPGGTGGNSPRRTIDELKNAAKPDPKGSPRTGNAINPGSGDDGAQATVGGANAPLPKRFAGFVDPPEAFGDLFGGAPTPGPSQGGGAGQNDDD